eukprot:CAMPEP_0185187120 /NCGR_PEP_ID=MMETSP1140-20130426/4519_1 /TAXON_ID=298111 /ORGANISM="Pavlova sp., Strain CCMP459" /LENGTH=73 /DNA_ID=CAMNT_0027753475 /DNA_START=746 /DNA_END=968 /DNA_ORIENTATION=-
MGSAFASGGGELTTLPCAESCASAAARRSLFVLHAPPWKDAASRGGLCVGPVDDHSPRFFSATAHRAARGGLQ